MKCANCGFEVDDQANFCSHCGTPVQHVTEMAEEPAAEAVMEEEPDDVPEEDSMEDELSAEYLKKDAGMSTGDNLKKGSYAALDDDDDEDYDDFAYQERRAKRQARKKKKARDKVILFVLVGVILVGALVFVVAKSLTQGDDKENSKVSQSSSVVPQSEISSSVVPSSTVEAEDPNKLSADELSTAVDTIQQQYEAIMSKRTAGEYKASAYKTGITAYWDGDSKISAIMAESGTEGSQYARSYFYDESGNLFYADLSGKDSYRLYFQDGKLIRLSYAKDASNTAEVTNYDQSDSKEYLDWESSALDYSATLMTEAKAAGIVKSQEEIDAEKAAEEERLKEEKEKKAEEEKKAAEEKKKAEEKEEEEETSSSSSGKSSEYIFPDSNSEYLAKSDLKGMSQSEVRRALNEIYARRGATFDTSANKKYFEGKSWYKATCSKSEAQKKFNKYEKTNVDLIVEYEKSKGWR